MSTLARRYTTLSRLQRWLGTNWASSTISVGIGLPGVGLDPWNAGQYTGSDQVNVSNGTIINQLTVPGEPNVEGLWLVKALVCFLDVAGTTTFAMSIRVDRDGTKSDPPIQLVRYIGPAGSSEHFTYEGFLTLRTGDIVEQVNAAATAATDRVTGDLHLIPVLN
jgi:hypothetical protein